MGARGIKNAKTTAMMRLHWRHPVGNSVGRVSGRPHPLPTPPALQAGRCWSLLDGAARISGAGRARRRDEQERQRGGEPRAPAKVVPSKSVTLHSHAPARPVEGPQANIGAGAGSSN